MKWLTETHARRFHIRWDSVGTGAVYQSRFVSRPIDEARKFFGALRYVEANALQHGVVRRAQDWPWSSAWDHESIGASVAIDDSPIVRPSNWLEILNDY